MELDFAKAVLAYAADVGEADDAPTTYQQAMNSENAPEWVKAMNAELKVHLENGSWVLVPKKKDVRPIGCRWVFAKKRSELGQVVRYKARLVAKGFKQKFGVDFFETYSAVASMNSIRVVLAVVVAMGYVTEQLDVDTAFLNSNLTEEVYMEVPHDDGTQLYTLVNSMTGEEDGGVRLEAMPAVDGLLELEEMSL
ncbi:af434192_2gag and pol [Plasmopara halstedii]|uniref:Af434192_2gag and pol n=1 Tax=Plasmopara halstedii TaxID=4781 RepID=A0A0P1AA19_PLAHL|nr:af434192_2gag and pol [Plasmopara halstedii]CEG37394.1 af434192_2gag and pol [Plasmopara halstedii]|eukprot:XP_024573763.1 af434192_2gag and pol [Plasmopara halstedii]